MAKNEILKNLNGKTYTFVSTEFRIDDPAVDLADFLVGSTYELPAGTYIFNEPPDWGVRNVDLITANGCYLWETRCPTSPHLYSGTAPFIINTGSGISLFMEDTAIAPATAKIFDLSNGGTLLLDHCGLIATDVGDVNGFGFVTIETSAMVACGDGLTCTDISSKIAAQGIQWNNGLNTGGNCIEVAGTIPPVIEVRGIDSQPKSNESFFLIASAWTGDAVITSGVHSTTSGGTFFNASGKDQTDVDIILSNVRNVKNSTYTIEATLGTVHSAGVPISNTQTTASVLNTPAIVEVNTGTANEEWRLINAERWTLSAAGRFTYIGKEDITALVGIISTVDASGGGQGDAIGVYAAKNGTVNDDSLGRSIAAAGEQIGTAVEIEMSTNDYLEQFIVNFTDTSSLLVTTSKVTITA